MTITEQIQERLMKLLDRGGRRLLGITGPPGAGKSTLAGIVADHLQERAAVVPMDGFHLSNIQLKRLGRAGRKGAPDTFDVLGFVALLTRLREQRMEETLYAPQFERALEESIAAAIAVDPEVPLVITEGNYLLLQNGGWAPVRSLVDEIWYVDVDAEKRQTRLIERHKRFGRSDKEARAWVDQTDEPNAKLIESTRYLADFFVFG